MKPARLLTHYERIADSPDAIPRLRRLILDLAVRGKLVPQNANDEPASELLKRIEREKARLVGAGKIRTPKPIPPLPAILSELPGSWSWSQIAEIGALSPRNEAPETAAASFVPMALIGTEYGVATRHEIRNWGEISQGYTHFAEGDVGLAKITPCFENGKSTVFRNLTGRIGSGTTELHVARPILVDQDYVLIFLKGPSFIEAGIPTMTGTAGQKRVPVDYFAYSPFPLPPLAEQHRIVAKVEELMALCDQLQAKRIERETARNRLTAASMSRLSGADQASFADGVRFVLKALPALTTRPDQIKELRQSILSLTLRGRLSPQRIWPPAAQKLKEVADLQNGYAFKSEWFAKSGTRLLRNANVGHDTLNWADEVRLPDSRVAEFERFRLKEGDVVLSLDRPFISTGTKVARVEARDLPALLLQRVGRFVLSELITPEYLCMWINSPLFSDQIDAGRSNGVPHVSSKQVEAATLFVPPLDEQRQLVTKVEELMALFDKVDRCLIKGLEVRARLFDALVNDATTT